MADRVDLTPWQKVKAKYEAGEFVPLHVRAMAEEVLGQRFLRPPRKGMRPDFRDREAGDTSFDDGDDGMVAL